MKKVLLSVLVSMVFGVSAFTDLVDDGLAAYDSGNYQKAATLFQKACDGGDAGGCFGLGLMYKHGDGVKHDYHKAVALYLKACDGGYAGGCYNLGLMYHNGQDVKKDYHKAAKFYIKACDAGEELGCHNSGVMYEKGHGVKKDYNKAVPLYTKACDGGYADACFNLGLIYDNGLGAKQDYKKAITFYTKACDGGNSSGCYNLAHMHMIGQGVKQNSNKAKELFSKACDGGLQDGCHEYTVLNREGLDDISNFLDQAEKASPDNTKWLFIVAIENYEFTDPVVYSANSAKRFKEVAQKRLGVPERNTRFLLNEGATAAKVRHHLQEMLSRVKKGDTVYLYYSGHGVPVAKQENAPYMLAQDMSPEYVAEDERFKLQNIYKNLSDSKAGKVVAFVDSCFSGGADNTALFKGVAATRLKPKDVTFDKQKMVVITAGSGLEYSNKYDDKSNRLFSYYLMRGLINNNSDMQRLYDFVKSNVQERSYEMGASYEQVPVYDGNIGLDL